MATPVLLLMLLAIVQFAMWSHATHIAQAAAAQGLSVTRVQSGTETAGESRAQEVLNDLGQGPLAESNVDASRTTTAATVEVTGVASSVIPFLRLPVHATATGATERFEPEH